jgi:hypothetical protein
MMKFFLNKDNEFSLQLIFSHFRQQPLELLFPQFVDRTQANIVRFFNLRLLSF